MDSPFIYYKYVTGKNFVGRRKDVTIISNFLSQGENVALIAPAKSGKMSLLQQSLYQMKMLHRNYVVAEVSLLDVRTVQEFLLRLGDAVIRTCANTPGGRPSSGNAFRVRPEGVRRFGQDCLAELGH